MRPKWADDVRMEDLQNATIRDLAEVVGIDAAVRLMEIYGGSNLYIPKPDATKEAVRNRHIREEFDGTNARALGYKYGVSQSWIYRLVSEGQVYGQMNMFEAIS